MTRPHQYGFIARVGAGLCLVALAACGAGPAISSPPDASPRVAVVHTPGAAGLVTSTPAGIDCGTTCTAAFSSGSTVTLTAEPAPDATFGGWSGACQGLGTCTLVLSADVSVSATFSPRRVPLEVRHRGPGTVFSSPGGIACGPVCAAEFDVGATVTLDPVPDDGAVFAGWSGACTGGGPCVVHLSQSEAVEANFSRSSVPVGVSLAGGGGGRVRSLPAGLDCGTECHASFTAGATIVLEAAADDGSRFAGWSGDCVGTSVCVLELEDAQAVTATFEPVAGHELQVATNGSGTVISTPAGIACGGACTASWGEGTQVALQAVADAGWQFTGWSGDCAGTSSCVVLLNGDRSVTATFEPVAEAPKHVLRVGVDGAGSVFSAPGGIACGNECSATFRATGPLALSAVPQPGVVFDGWSGDCAGMADCILTMDADHAAVATFRALPSSAASGVPVLQALDPAAVPLGAIGATVRISGFGFVPGSTVLVGGTRRPAAFLDPTSMRVTLADADASTAKTWSVTVLNPAPGGGTSNALTLSINRPVPTIDAVSPTTVLLGQAPVTFTVTGTGFASGFYATSVYLGSTLLDTTWVSPTEVTAVLKGVYFTPQVVPLTVQTFAPGGGRSAPLNITVVAPTPTIAAAAPTTATAGDGPLFVSIHGSGFLTGSPAGPKSVVRWNGQDREVAVASATDLKLTLTSADLLLPSTSTMTVVNPGPGGGETQAVAFVVVPRPPRITSTIPSAVVAGGGAFTLEVVGAGFTPGSTVTWRGVPRPTTYVSPQRLRIDVSAADVASVGSAALAVTPGPAFGFPILAPSPSVTSRVVTTLAARDLAFDPVRGLVLASVGASAAANANQVVALAPATGNVVATMTAGSNPSRLAISRDATKLYAAIDGTNSVQRFSLDTRTSDLTFTLGGSVSRPNWASQLDVLPNAPRSVAVARVSGDHAYSYTQSTEGVAIYDDGVQRPATAGLNTVAVASPDAFYTYDSNSSARTLTRVQIGPNGAVGAIDIGSLATYNLDVLFDAGRLYASNGQVVELNGELAGTCPAPANAAVLPDAIHGRIFVLAGTSLTACNPATFTTLGSVTLQDAAVAGARFVRFGVDGIAYRTATQVVFLRSDLIGG